MNRPLFTRMLALGTACLGCVAPLAAAEPGLVLYVSPAGQDGSVAPRTAGKATVTIRSTGGGMAAINSVAWLKRPAPGGDL